MKASLQASTESGLRRAIQIPERFAARMSDDAIWAESMKFLDRGISKGHGFRLASSPSREKAGTGFQKENLYLLSKGYVFTPSRNAMVPGIGARR